MVRNNTDKVMRRQRFKNWNEEFDQMFVLGIDRFQKKVFVMENNFRVHILDKNPESFSFAVNLIIPLEIGSDSQFHFEGGTSAGLNVSGQFKLGKLVNLLVNGLS